MKLSGSAAESLLAFRKGDMDLTAPRGQNGREQGKGGEEWSGEGEKGKGKRGSVLKVNQASMGAHSCNPSTQRLR